MAYTPQLLTFLVFSTFVFQTLADEPCQPKHVENLTVDETTLSWTINSDESCTISFYMVYIHGSTNTEFAYTVEETKLDISNLPVCDSYRFTVSAVSSDNIESLDRILFKRLSLPPGANLTVDFVKVSDIGHGHGIYLQWAMEDRWQMCAERFRVIVYDEDDDIMIDQYTNYLAVTVARLIPCTSYSLGVVAIYDIETEGPITVISHRTDEDVLSPPILEDIKLEGSKADLTWRLQRRKENRCPASELLITSDNLKVRQKISDENNRPSIPLTLNNLLPNSIYLLNVTATNSAGTSNPTLVAIQTLDSN